MKFLKDRYEAMKNFPMFDNIEYTEDIEEMKKWIPLMMKGRENNSGVMAASKIDEGTDVNYGALTRKMAKNLHDSPNVEVQYNHEVVDFERLSNGKWLVKIKTVTLAMYSNIKQITCSSVLVVAQSHYYKNRYP